MNINLDRERLLITLATAAAASAALSLLFSWCRVAIKGLGAGGFSPARRWRVPVGEIEPLGPPRGDGAGGFISIAPRDCDVGKEFAAGGEDGGYFPLVWVLDRTEGDGERDLDKES